MVTPDETGWRVDAVRHARNIRLLESVHIFVRPRTSRFVGTVLPDILEVVEAIARNNGETVQVHGAEAARRFKLSSQMPTAPVFHTSASSRTIRITNITVRMVHTSNRRRLQFAGEAAGAALSALWYLGKDNVTSERAHSRFPGAVQCVGKDGL